MSAETILATLVWASVGLVLYTYVGYPIIIGIAARLYGRTQNESDDSPKFLPHVSLVVVAHNEEKFIERRIENALALDYPSDRLEVIVASDGSTDQTVSLACKCIDPRLRVLAFEPRRGKSATLNMALAAAVGEVIVLSDANTEMETASLRRLVAPMADASVGVVCGKLVIVDPATGRNVDGMYWRYETFLKRCEARLDALLGANGGIYAVRRTVVSPLAEDTIVDDFVLPLEARLRTGCRSVYCEAAVAYEDAPRDIRHEFRRRVRIGAGDFQSLRTLSPLLHPKHGWLAVSFFSHKLLRWCCPLFLITAIIGSLVLSSRPTFAVLLAAQIALYTLALCGIAAKGTGRAVKLIRLSTMFCAMNLALAVGFLQHLSGRNLAAWKRTER